MSTRVLVTAGFTMPKVGIVHPVSKTGAMPNGRELVALMVEAHGDDPVRAIAFHVEKTARVLR